MLEKFIGNYGDNKGNCRDGLFNDCCSRCDYQIRLLRFEVMQNKEPERKEEHPFPNKELALIVKLNVEGKIPVEDVAVISNLINKYLNLRAYVFHEI